MITAITGLNGSGKTSFAMDWLFFDDNSHLKPRPKVIEGIEILDSSLIYSKMPALDWVKNRENWIEPPDDTARLWDESHPDNFDFQNALANATHPLELWYLWAKPDTVIVVDEVQRFARPRSVGSRIPLWIKQLDYHRHYGIDFIFLCMRPTQLDSDLRKLIGEHITIAESFLGRKKYHWSGRTGDYTSKTDRDAAYVQRYKLPKHTFGTYKSTVLNTSVKPKKPFWVYALYGSPLIIVALVYAAYNGRHAISHTAPHADLPAESSSPPKFVGGFGFASSVPAKPRIPSFESHDKAHPEYAQAYDDLRKVTAMPLVSACLATAHRCVCYTQQATRVDMSDSDCRKRVDKKQFNPYLQAVISQPEQSNKTTPPQNQQSTPLTQNQAIQLSSVPQTYVR